MEEEERRIRKWWAVKLLHHVVSDEAYRYHSLERAMDSVAGAGFVVSQAELVAGMMGQYQFDRALKMDLHLRSLYACFEGAEKDAVDYRDIVCCVRFLQHHRGLRENPRRLLTRWIDMFSVAGQWIARRDALRLVRMGAVTDADVRETSGRLDRYLTEAAPEQGLKPNFQRVSVSVLMEILENNPSLTESFRTQLWQLLPGEWRLDLLHAKEEQRFQKVGHNLIAMKHKRAMAWHAKAVCKRHFQAWLAFWDVAKRQKEQRRTVSDRSRRITLRRWCTWAGQASAARRKSAAAAEFAKNLVLRRYLTRIRQHVTSAKKVRALTWRSSKHGKQVMAGVGVLRSVLRVRSQRAALRHWRETASLLSAWDFAESLAAEKMSRRAFNELRDLVQALAAQRRADREAEERAEQLAAAVQFAEEEKRMLAEAAEAAAKRKKAAAKAALMAERAAQHQERLAAEQTEKEERETKVLARQRQARRRRVYEERVQVQKDFEEAWDVRVREMADREMAVCRAGLDSNDQVTQLRIEKELKVVKRKFFAAPSPETADLERALQDPANVIFAHMAHKLYEKGLTLKQFFHQFDQGGDGYLAYDEFKVMVTSLGIKLTGEQIRAVLRSIDLDGGGFIDFPEFEAALSRHEEVCGVAGSPWKMYVNPVHAVMTFHNVITDEEIWDYKAKDADLVNVIKDNIVGVEGIRARELGKEQQAQAWEDLQLHRAATVLQRQYRVWAARRKRSLVRWKAEAEAAKVKSKAANLSATTMQCWWRGMRAKWRALALLDVTIETLCDPGSRTRYYFNHCTKDAAWKPPFMLRRWKGAGTHLQGVPGWIYIIRAYGEAFYFNTKSGDRQEDKPTGYMRCMACNIQLATKVCETEGRALCFPCYRGEHVEGDRCWHKWSPAPVHTCGVCKQRDSTVVCQECYADGIELCEKCWDRTHSNQRSRGHKPVPLDDWAVSALVPSGPGEGSAVLAEQQERLAWAQDGQSVALS